MIAAWNRLFPDVQVKTIHELFKIIPIELLIQERIFIAQLTQDCPNLTRAIQFFTLKPILNGNYNKLINAMDIQQVLEQYMQMYPVYHFVGCFTREFAQLRQHPLRPFVDLNQHDIGLIMSTATKDAKKQNKTGHWVSIFKSKDSNVVEYFDSCGKAPAEDVQCRLSVLFGTTHCVFNTYKHQWDGKICGMYALLFQIMRCVGQNKEWFSNTHLSDQEMENFKTNLFIYHKEN